MKQKKQGEKSPLTHYQRYKKYYAKYNKYYYLKKTLSDPEYIKKMNQKQKNKKLINNNE